MRIFAKTSLFAILLALFLPRVQALEVNYWPVFTGESNLQNGSSSWQSIGPIVFEEETEKREVFGVRPFYVQFDDKKRNSQSWHFLYPILNSRTWETGYSWDIFTLIRYQSFVPEDRESTRSFRVFPILFWGSGPDPLDSHFGVFPIAGRTSHFFVYQEARWVLFPLWARFQRGETTTWAAPWPFVRVVRGPNTRGFHLWPIYGSVSQQNVSEHRYWLWPLGYNIRRELWREQPYHSHGMLPFYSASKSERAVSRTFIWPFFGFTDSFDPEYSETRYFWPLFVQRRGESYINRWAPFYTRSIRSGMDRRWILWPFHRRATWEERNLLNERTQFLYFLYWSNVQSSPVNPDLAPAIKQHVWPFYSYWDNGAGHIQFQTLSPFEVFFPFNDVVRAKYSPLFAFYRYEAEKDVRIRHSVLFNFVTATRHPADERFQLNVGPLLTYAREKETKQWEFLKGLLSWERTDEGRSFGAFWMNRPEIAAKDPQDAEEVDRE